MAFPNDWVLSVFAAYFAVLIGIAVVRSRRMRELQDYVLGRRRLSTAATALSASSSTVSSGSMLVVWALCDEVNTGIRTGPDHHRVGSLYPAPPHGRR